MQQRENLLINEILAGDFEPSPSLGTLDSPDVPAMGLHNLLDDRETVSGSLLTVDGRDGAPDYGIDVDGILGVVALAYTHDLVDTVVAEHDIEVPDAPCRVGGKLDAVVASLARTEFRRVVAERVCPGTQTAIVKPVQDSVLTCECLSGTEDETPVRAPDL